MAKFKSESFGRYEILCEVGRGAMGVVYKARDPKINRTVAVKTISMAGQPAEEEREYRERFFREAEAAGRLSHPGIVTIFDVGEEPETREPYIVMEFVGGESLDKLLTGGDRKLPLERALQLTHELAEALDCAQTQGVVHRDLKPANILITEEGHPKIADFGVAKLNLANHTLAGRALGTPAYMSPEQLNGEAVDGRSDLFSLGVILYTMVTGHRPFQGNSALTVSFKVVNREPIPATVLETKLPEGLDYIIDKAMAKDPAERYQRGMEVALDIQDLKEGRPLRSKTKHTAAPSQALGTPKKGTSIALQSERALSLRFDNIRRNVFTVALLLGILILAVRVSRPFRSEALPSTLQLQHQVQQHPIPVPTAAEVATLKQSAPPVAKNAPNALPTTLVLAASAPSAHLRGARPAPAILPAPPAKKVVKARAQPLPAEIKPVSLSATAPIPASVPATLEIEIEHKFAEAELTIWVDDRLTYSHSLEGIDKKRLGLFHHVQGHEFHAVQISPGNHGLRVKVVGGDPATEKTGSITGDFASGNDKMLHVGFDKRGEMTLSLDNDPSMQTPPKAP
jgi:serine/threonine-protein kinase